MRNFLDPSPWLGMTGLARDLCVLAPLRETIQFLNVLSGMIEIPRLQAKRGLSCRRRPASIFGFVGRPKKTWIPAPDRVRGALRRNDEKMSRLPVDEFRTAQLEAEGHSGAFFAANSPLPSTCLSSTARRRRSSGLCSRGSLRRDAGDVAHVRLFRGANHMGRFLAGGDGARGVQHESCARR